MYYIGISIFGFKFSNVLSVSSPVLLEYISRCVFLQFLDIFIISLIIVYVLPDLCLPTAIFIEFVYCKGQNELTRKFSEKVTSGRIHQNSHNFSQTSKWPKCTLKLVQCGRKTRYARDLDANKISTTNFRISNLYIYDIEVEHDVFDL